MTSIAFYRDQTPRGRRYGFRVLDKDGKVTEDSGLKYTHPDHVAVVLSRRDTGKAAPGSNIIGMSKRKQKTKPVEANAGLARVLEKALKQGVL